MSAQILDLRELASNWKDALATLSRPSELDDETRAYRKLCSELGIDATPDDLESYGDSYEPTLIREDYFTEYAQELAEDIGAVPSELGWPMRCIDWESAADELKMDYTSVEFDGDTYYIRSC